MDLIITILPVVTKDLPISPLLKNVCVGVSYKSCYFWMPRACRQTIEGDAQVRVAVKTQGVSPRV